MKRKKQKPSSTQPPTQGPIARKVIAFARKHLDRSAIIPIDDLRNALEQQKQAEKTIVSPTDLEDRDPLFAVYVLAQNHLSLYAEQLANIPALHQLASQLVKAEDEYLPEGPPMSPLTKSYFAYWSLCDLSTPGPPRESLASVVIEFLKVFAHPGKTLPAYEAIRDSRMGVYRVENVSGRFIFLREFVTGARIKTICNSGYSATPDHIIYARVLPPPVAETGPDYSAIVTTPYVMGFLTDSPHTPPPSNWSWDVYFDRQFGGLSDSLRLDAYHRHMKYGPNPNYWNEFIFQAYVNSVPGSIYLAGLPDLPESLPHSSQSRFG